MPNSRYRMPLDYLFLACVFCYSSSFLFVVFCVFVFFFCSHSSLVDVPLIFFCPADHVPDWQPRILLGMVEARSVNVKKTTRSSDSSLNNYTLDSVLYCFKRKIRTHLDLLNKPQSGGKNVKTFSRWDQQLKIQNLFMALFGYVWKLCMGINISVQYNGRFLPGIILLTQSYLRGTRLNTMHGMGCVLTTYIIVYYYYIV